MTSTSSISIKLLMLLALVNICVSQDFDFFLLRTTDTLLFYPRCSGQVHSATQKKFAASLQPENQHPISAFMDFGQISTMEHFHSIAIMPKTHLTNLRRQKNRQQQQKQRQQSSGNMNGINMAHVLRIKPDGNIYSVVNITEAIKQATGFVPGVTCNTDPSGNRQLSEIYMCVEKSASMFIECPLLPNGIRSCTKTIEFPIF
ncbi:unnamed protein product [Sphenostylis stenocarpa]|uniref:Uncharacterized protein n=1 Tax=Sphenostylis stenocarpa TaxID=92480 RepID=A0AA86S581_9FABA|nr:unnamed protein product [Sphenostylis stenocarpa]